MKKAVLLFILFLAVFCISPIAYAQTGHMYLLAVSGPENNIGSIADLYLTIEPGQGRVFLDTFPLTQIDTQMSTRMAKQIACDFLERDCSNMDFFYTIRARSAIVGGPSAGSALSALTVAMLDNLQVNESVVVTGSINSGGIIGPVGGIESKINAAQKNNFTKILIPNTDFHPENKTNASSNLTIRVIEVSNLGEIVYEITGKKYEESDTALKIDSSYELIMKNVAFTMCNHAEDLKKEAERLRKDSNISFEKADNMTEEAKNLINESSYPAASYCFRANVELRTLINSGIDEKQALMEFNDLRSSIEAFEESINQKEIKTISDLQTKIIVKERLMDAKTVIREGIDSLGSDISAYDLSYAQERFYSAVAWANFFEMKGKEIKLDRDVLMTSCINKISEAEERYQYVGVMLDFEGNSTKDEISRAREYLEDEEYEMCLFKASKAKSDLDVTLTVIGITEEGLSTLIDEKLKVAKEQISKEISRGFFPIMGYSYYLYSIELKESEPVSSLIYAELSMELSNMRPYFEQPSDVKIEGKKESLFGMKMDFLEGFILGVLSAGIICFFLVKVVSKKSNNQRKTNKR